MSIFSTTHNTDITAIKTSKKFTCWLTRPKDNMMTDDEAVETAVLDAFLDYKTTATFLIKSKLMINLRNDIKNYYQLKTVDSEYSTKTFFAIAAPSGSGKTQVAFTLAEFPDLDVVHVCLTASHRAQPVYKHPSIDLLSDVLRDALVKDNDENRDGDKRTTKSLLGEGRKLRTVVVLSLAFQLLGEDGQFVQTAKELRAVINAKIRDRSPVLIVDEAFQQQLVAPKTKREEKNRSTSEAVFLRSVLRASGIAAVFMGTTANMATFVGEGTDISFQDIAPRPWAKFISQLPDLEPTTVITVAQAAKQAATGSFAKFVAIATQFPKENPRCVHFLHEAARTAPDAPLRDLLATVAHKLYNGKATLRTVEGIRAQMLYILNSSGPERMPTLVTTHFAQFNSDEVLDTVSGFVVVRGKVHEWMAEPSFPTASDNPLLSLLLVGASVPMRRGDANGPLQHPQPFVLRAEGVDPTVLTAAASVLVSTNCAQMNARLTSAPLCNPNAGRRDGNLVEAIAAVGAVNASRAGNSIAGVKAVDFILQFVCEVQAFAMNLQWQDPDVLSRCWSAANMVVPLLMRVDDDCAKVLRDKLGLTVGYVTRPGDSLKVDLAIFDADGNILVRIESKNYKTSDNQRHAQGEGGVSEPAPETESVVETSSTSATAANSPAYMAMSGGVDSKEALNILLRHHKDCAPLTIALVSRLVDLQKDLPVEYLVDTHVFVVAPLVICAPYYY